MVDSNDLRFTSFINKNTLMKAVSDRLFTLVNKENVDTKDDTWQKEFDELIQLLYELRVDDHSSSMEMMFDQLQLLEAAYQNQADDCQLPSSFYEFTITINGNEFEIPFNTNIFLTLIEYAYKYVSIEKSE